MNKLKQWYKKVNKFEKTILILLAVALTFLLFILLINIVIALAYAGIKLKAITWQIFSTAYIKDICFKISAIIGIIVVLVFVGFIGYQKWQHFDMFAYEQKKKSKRQEREFKQIPQDNLLKLNKKFGLIKSNLTQHTLLVGTTGNGKTTTLLQIIKELIFKFHETTIIIDGKGDIDLIDKIKRPYPTPFIWKIGGETEYSPFATKDSVVLSDKIMSLFDFSEPHYEALANDYVLILTETLITQNIDLTLENVIKYFDINELKQLISKKDKNYEYLEKINQNDILGMRSRLNVYRQQLKTNISVKNSLFDLSKQYKTILFSINSLMCPKLSGAAGKIIIQDLKELTTIKPVNQKINIILDEFNVFASENIVNLINKSRPFNYQCFLSFQTINDLKTNNMNFNRHYFWKC